MSTTSPERRKPLGPALLGCSILNLVLAGVAFTLILPFCWMVLTSMKALPDVGDPNWVPTPQPALARYDLGDPPALVNALLDPSTPVEASLARQVSDQTRLLFERYDEEPEALDERIRNELIAVMGQGVIFGPDLGQRTGFESIETSERTKAYEVKRDTLRERVAEAEAKAQASGDVADQREVREIRARADRASALANRSLLADALPGLVSPPRTLQLPNFGEVFRIIPFARYYWNSLLVSSWITFLQVLTSCMAAFSFARLRWKGRDTVFLLYLSTMMLPGLVMMIPNFQIMIALGLVDTLPGLIIPAAFTAFGTFLLRQFMLSIPSSLDEAAEIDGASKWRVFWEIIVPLARPGIVTLAIFTFVGSYHSFFWPLVMLRSEHLYTLPIGLLAFDNSSGQQTNLMMAAVTMSVLPVIVVFVMLQKQLVAGIQLGAVKG